MAEVIGRDRAERLMERHLAIFNDPDRSRREQAMRSVFTSDVVFTDPHRRGVGHAGYNDAADALHARIPGFSIAAARAPDVHHDLARCAWTLTEPGGRSIGGIDVIRFRDDLIAEVAIFVDPTSVVPPPARRQTGIRPGGAS